VPGITFYAYTKSLALDFTGRPSNLKIIGSVGGILDHKLLGLKALLRIDAVAQVFDSEEELYRADRVYVNCSEHDLLAILVAKKGGHIGLIKH
jgi:hypothetical protein